MYSIERPLEPPDFPAPDCFREEINDLPTEELAELIGAQVINAEDAREVHKPYGRMRYCLR